MSNCPFQPLAIQETFFFVRELPILNLFPHLRPPLGDAQVLPFSIRTKTGVLFRISDLAFFRRGETKLVPPPFWGFPWVVIPPPLSLPPPNNFKKVVFGPLFPTSEGEKLLFLGTYLAQRSFPHVGKKNRLVFPSCLKQFTFPS